jgi:DNA-binding transcriptional ArsR family regulator
MPFRSRLYVLTRLWVELTLEMGRIHAPEFDLRIGGHAADLLLLTAVYLGTIEGQHMNASQLADHARLPRPTVLRHLASLEQVGLIERRGKTWRMAFKALTRAEQHDLTAIADALSATLDELRY